MLKNKASAETIQRASATLRSNLMKQFDGDKSPATREQVAKLYIHSMLTLDILLYASDLLDGSSKPSDREKLMSIIEQSINDMAVNLTGGLSDIQNARLGK